VYLTSFFLSRFLFTSWKWAASSRPNNMLVSTLKEYKYALARAGNERRKCQKNYICKEGCGSIGSCRKKLTVQLINLKQQLRKELPTLSY